MATMPVASMSVASGESSLTSGSSVSISRTVRRVMLSTPTAMPHRPAMSSIAAIPLPGPSPTSGPSTTKIPVPAAACGSKTSSASGPETAVASGTESCDRNITAPKTRPCHS
ncbi:hypothetical protein WKI71_30280 [Streptomyces sp. MS1.AVA.1]|uniref:Uncharacterized protein n=1 Tax=Streptomyces machairae TaxID=3134109 RepID=A0ABU8UQF5_9ACTN